MPGIAKRGVSRKVVDPGERDRLKAIVRELEVPEGLGFIVRTAGTGASRDDLKRDLDYLLRLWEQMKTRIAEHSAPVLLYQENDLVIRTLRDLYDGQGEIIIDDRPTMEKARQFVSQIMPACVDKVSFHDSDRPLFSHYGVENEITRLLENRIELKSGASLIIEQTEALVAIDVNSGRFKPDGGSGIEDTAFAVNSEAAVEIARQIRLRDLGGVVVVDFIDMRAERHRKQLENIFKEALRRDRARIKVARFSPFGIIELTRQRVRSSLKRTVHQRCPYCTGTGYIPSDETSALAVVRTVRENLARPGAVLVVTVRPEVAEAVLNQHRRSLADLEQASRKTIFVRGDHRLSYEDIEIRPMVALPDDLDHRHS
jgi:ribonuclease E